MIHYHGTPVSGSDLDAAKFLAGRHAFVPFLSPQNLAIALETCQSVALDNSAFSLWRSGGGDVDVPAYRAWLSTVAGHPAVDWAIIPDKIDGSEDDNRALVYAWRTIEGIEAVPVWHLHESLEWLDELVGGWRTVALGSSGRWSQPGTDAWWRRMAEAMAVACTSDGRPRTRLHGLRMLNPDIFRHLPLSSADSTNAAVNAGSLSRYGSYPAPTAGQRASVIAARIEAHQSAARWVVPTAQMDMGDLWTHARLHRDTHDTHDTYEAAQ